MDVRGRRINRQGDTSGGYDLGKSYDPISERSFVAIMRMDRKELWWDSLLKAGCRMNFPVDERM